MELTEIHGNLVDRNSFETPRTNLQRDDCDFYHTMEIPGCGIVNGMWDLRGKEAAYLGGVRFHGKRVLEIGAASGHLSFWMEGRGAEVIAFDLSEEMDWDAVPYGGEVDPKYREKRREHIRRLHNGFWFAHAAHRSKVEVVYGHASRLPAAIGPVDIATFCCVLLHLKDPFMALQSSLRLTRETVVVTEPLSRLSLLPRWPSIWPSLKWFFKPRIVFHPDPDLRLPLDSWWQFSPACIMAFLGVLGFGCFQVSFHRQRTKMGKASLFTVVGRRLKLTGTLPPPASLGG